MIFFFYYASCMLGNSSRFCVCQPTGNHNLLLVSMITGKIGRMKTCMPYPCTWIMRWASCLLRVMIFVQVTYLIIFSGWCFCPSILWWDAGSQGLFAKWMATATVVWLLNSW
jgi:hypothetical protein